MPKVVKRKTTSGKSSTTVAAVSNSKEKYSVLWNERYNQLIDYKEKNGDCNVSTHDEANKQLGSWVMNQRTRYKKNKLSPEQIKFLKEIGFEWEVSSPKYSARRKEVDDQRWNERYNQLIDYKDKNGHCNISTYGKTNVKLGRWVDHQRTAYKKGKLSSEQIESMNGIGFEWVRHKIVGWDERWYQLIDYMEKNGHCNVPDKYNPNQQLANWVSNQRQNYNKNKLSQERTKLLNDIGFEWEVRRKKSSGKKSKKRKMERVPTKSKKSKVEKVEEVYAGVELVMV